MAEQALYRKYRSADFSEVVGQEHVTKTLTTAISSGRLSHAYLFTGPRGVGKTSVARLLARALNCTGDPKPCNQCTTCTAAINSSLDVIEIDAASNRRIEEVRDLRDKIGLAPAIGKYKVYIIDEVHMLTTEAFNALLKTLEEPPAHAVFILATTEVHKLPETIVSRTQRFNFKPITMAYIISHLQKIAEAEGIVIEPEALDIIATASRGGFRDAISMLDQLASSGQSPVTAETVRNLLGYSDRETIGALGQAIAAHDAKSAFDQLGRLMDQGSQPGQVTAQLLELLREALLVKVGAAPAGEGPAAGLAETMETVTLAAAIELLAEVIRSAWPQLSLEAAVARLAAAPVAVVAPAPVASPRVRAAAPSPTATAVVPEQIQVEPPNGELTMELWPKALLAIKQKNVPLYAILRSCRVELEGAGITIYSKFVFHKDRLAEAKNRQVIEQAIDKTYGRNVQLVIELDTAAVAAPATAAPTNDLVSSALEILGGEIVE